MLNGLFGSGECAVAVGVFFCQLGAEVAGGGVDVDFALGEAAFKFGVAGLDGVGGVAGDDDDEVGSRLPGEFAHLDGGFREALGEALEIVDELGAFLQIEEGVIFFALLAAQFAYVGNAQGDDGQGGIDLQRGEGGVRNARSARR